MSAFLIKYRNEYLFVFPIIAVLFTYYLLIGLHDASIAQNPQKLHRDKGLILIVTVLIVSLVIFTYIDLPIAQFMIESEIGMTYFLLQR